MRTNRAVFSVLSESRDSRPLQRIAGNDAAWRRQRMARAGLASQEVQSGR
jgi:hypothetical protein